MLKVEVETLSPIRRRLRVEVPREQVVEEIERAYSALSRQARIPGFRPGRAPRHVLERQFGDHVRSEVFGKLIQQSLSEAVEREEIAVIGAPQIETEHAKPGEPLRYSATVEVYPRFDVTGYQGLDLERPSSTASDDDVDRYLANLRESLSQLRPIEDRTAVRRGDVALIDYEGRLDGKVVTRGENRNCEIGRGQFPPGFEDRLVGAEVGAVVDFDLPMPDDYGVAEIAGKVVAFHVVLRGIAAKETPELDDEFAKDHGECDTLDQLRDRVRAQIQAMLESQADARVRTVAVAKLVELQGDIEVPRAMVEQRLEQLMHEVTDEWRARRIWPKDQEAAFSSMRQELLPRAEGNVKGAIVLDAIAAKEGLEVSDAAVEEEVERIAAGAGDAGDRVRALYGAEEARDSLRAQLRRQQVIEYVVAQATIRNVPASPPSVVAGEGESR